MSRLSEESTSVSAVGRSSDWSANPESGKTLTALSIIGLAPPAAQTQGSIMFDGQETLGRRESDLNRLRGRRIGIVFQDAMQALNPMLSIRTRRAW
jgi:ABC-type glutathione transport system ATPase component